MEAGPAPSPSGPQRPTTRELIAGAALVAVGLLGAFLPIAVLALVSTIYNPSGAGLNWLVGAFRAVLAIPLSCAVSLLVARGLYLRSPWSRAAGTAIGAVLLVSPVVSSVVTVLIGDSVGPVGFGVGGMGSPLEAIAYHVFLAPAGQVVPFGIIVAALGLLVIAALRFGTPSEAAPVVERPARRPGAAMALLFLTGILSIGPYVAWLLASVIPPAVEANGGGPSSGTFGANPTIGLLYAVACLLAAVPALAAARAIRTRAGYGPWIAPAASVASGSWSALWLVVLGNSIGLSDSGGVVPVAVTLLLFGLALVSGLSFTVVIPTVYRRRRWFEPSTMSSVRRAPRRPGRFWTATAGIGLALAVPLALAAAAAIGRPEPIWVAPGAAVFEGETYFIVGPAIVPPEDLRVAGTLEAWDPQANIDDPTAFAIAGIPTTDAIALMIALPEGGAQLSAFAPSREAGDGGAYVVAAELCPYLDIASPASDIPPCGPPVDLEAFGVRYARSGEAGFVLSPDDLAVTATLATVRGTPDPRVDLRIHVIRDVPTDEAIALLAGSRIVLYVSGYPAALCRYSPVAVSDPLQTEFTIKKSGGDSGDVDLEPLLVPSGCEFPEEVLYDGGLYVQDRPYELFDVPASAVTPIGQARIPGREAFPPTLDDTVYAIAGVDPAVAVTLAVPGRFVVMVAVEGGPIPEVLCPYVPPDVLERYRAEDDPDIGCDGSSG